jgi:uncharacterized protein (TIGR03083 family)
MEFSEHIAALRREGELLGVAAARADLDMPIPTSPEWRMRDLVRHIGDVHRWAAAHVRERRAEPIRKAAEVAGPLPPDEGLIDWFCQGHEQLVRTLETADPDLLCWSFLPAPSSVAFWARRQAHETGIHRADAESPRGTGAITPFPPEFAADGIEELLFGFLGRPAEDVRPERPRTLHLHPTDTEDEWLVRLGQDGFEVSRDHAEADCMVRGTASDLQLLLWNRRAPDGLDVTGDRALLAFWRETVQVRWSRGR